MQPNKSQVDYTTRCQEWSLTALAAELRELEVLPPHKVGVSGSPYSVSIFKIASIVNGAGRSYLPTGLVFQSIQQASCRLGIKEREALRVWRRALRNAKPRFPKETGF